MFQSKKKSSLKMPLINNRNNLNRKRFVFSLIANTIEHFRKTCFTASPRRISC